MINPTREQVAVSLFALINVPAMLVSGGGLFNVISRRPRLWEDCPAFPAIYMGQPLENYKYDNGTATPAVVALDFDIFIYTNAGQDPNVIPDTAMNNCIDALEAAIQPLAGGQIGAPQTLGGIVDHCWIEEMVHRDPGYINGQGMALLTIRALVPQ